MMKYVFLVFVVLSLLVVGCSSSENDIGTAEEATEATAGIAEDLDEVGDTLDSLGEDLG